MKRRALWAVSLVIAVVILVAAGCQGGQNKLVVGTSADYEPFEYIDEDGNYTGFDIELMEEIAGRMGVELEWQDIAFDGLIGSLQNDKIDAIIAAMSATEEREEQVDFTDPYFISGDAVLVAEDSDITLEDKVDIAGHTVGVQTGTIQETWIDENVGAEISRYERAEQAIMDLKSGRIEMVAMDLSAANSFVEQGGIKVALETDFSGEHMAIAVKEGNTELKEEFDAIIDELQMEGFIDDLAAEYDLE
jgi:polar amino acid transport system substrate-binding protein